jgi:di/tricarboxylate transporter
MKNLIIIVLVLLGIYWLFVHESFVLYKHSLHRIIGVVLLVLAAFFTWKWKFKK